jgi:hypothetical protein
MAALKIVLLVNIVHHSAQESKKEDPKMQFYFIY